MKTLGSFLPPFLLSFSFFLSRSLCFAASKAACAHAALLGFVLRRAKIYLRDSRVY